ncbi:uncharacterized protein LOC143890977 [Tasmannia lanceolata]|uniref:uncharacterized protein LOC143890977 n=1 Tax=Tasmannia lanceolata TaxID=3420 RepID=UPI0040648A4A
MYHFHGEVHILHSSIQFFLSIVYAKDRGSERRNVWDSLRLISQSITHPWAVLGDFNAIRFDEESLGVANLIQADVEEFNDCIFDCALAQVRSVGHFYSWSNCSNTGNLKLRRLDRCLVNEEWLYNFPLTLANYKNSGLSDHSPLIVQMGQDNAKRKTPFRFLNMWLDDLSLYEVVEKALATKIKGNPMFRVVKKLKAVKESIKTWNRNIFGRVDNQLPIAKLDLDNIQSQLASDPANPLLKSKEFEAKQNVISLSNLEEIPTLLSSCSLKN